MTVASELNPLLPHPIEIVFVLHALLALGVLVTGVVLGVTGRVRFSVLGWIGFLVLTLGPLVLVGPVAAVVLLAGKAASRPTPAPGPASTHAPGEHVCSCGQPAQHPS